MHPEVPAGRLVVVDDGDGVLCHECARPYRLLAAHVRQTHGLSAAAYREKWGLNRSTALACPTLRQARVEEGHRRYRLPAVREGLAQGQQLARAGQLLRLSHAAQPPGSARPQRREDAAAVTADARMRAKAEARDRLERRLADLGFPDFAAYWARRYLAEGQPMLAIRRELGVGGGTLARLLDQHGVPARRTTGGPGPAAARWTRRAAGGQDDAG